MKKIEIVYSKYFSTLRFEEYINIKIKDSELKDQLLSSPLCWKFPLDMGKDFMNNYFLCMLENCKTDLRSQNKSSDNTNNVARKIFFKNYDLYHHHIIDKNIYSQQQNKYGITIQTSPKRNIQNEIEDYCHTSSIYLHYQKKEEDENIKIKFLLFSKHPGSKEEWDQTKDNLNSLF